MASYPLLSEPYRFRRNLFTDENGSPIKFSMRPCEERTRLRPVIEHGGGLLTSKSSTGTIRLAEPGCRILSENCYSTCYVWDSAKANKLLPLQDYKSQENRLAEQSDVSESDSVIHRTTGTSHRKFRGKRQYYVGDDQQIIDFISSTRRYAEIKGTALWKDMERKKVLHGRTWQSLKERFVKQILPSISTYKLSYEEIKHFREPFSNEKDRHNSEDNSSTDDEVNDDVTCLGSVAVEDCVENSGPKKYTVKEDMAIIRFILQDIENLTMLRGNTLWKSMNILKVTSHSWQSMKERFQKRILPNITAYDIPRKYENRLQKLKALYPITTGAKNNITIKKECVTVEDSESPGSSSCNGFPVHKDNHQEVTPLSTNVNKIEASGSDCEIVSLTNITRTCDETFPQFSALEDKLEGLVKGSLAETSSSLMHHQLKTVVVKSERLENDKVLKTGCIVSGHVDLIATSDVVLDDMSVINEDCFSTQSIASQNRSLTPSNYDGRHFKIPQSAISSPDKAVLAFSDSKSFDNNLDNVMEVIPGDIQVDDPIHKDTFNNKIAEETEVRVACPIVKKTSSGIADSMVEVNHGAKFALTEVNTIQPVLPASLCAASKAKLKLNGSCVAEDKIPVDDVSKLETAEASFNNLSLKDKTSRMINQRFHHVARNFGVNFSQSPVDEENQESHNPSEKGHCAAAAEDSESGDSHNSTCLKPRKRLRLASGSTGGSEMESDDKEKSTTPKQIIPEKGSASPSSKRSKTISDDTHSHVARRSTCALNVSGDSCTEASSPLRPASESKSDKTPSPQVVVISELSDSPCKISSGLTPTPTKEACNPRLHALNRRKEKAHLSHHTVEDAREDDHGTLSDNTEPYFPSDAEGDLTLTETVSETDKLSCKTNVCVEDEERLVIEMQKILGLKMHEVYKVLSGSNFNSYLVFKQLLDETSDGEDV